MTVSLPEWLTYPLRMTFPLPMTVIVPLFVLLGFAWTLWFYFDEDHHPLSKIVILMGLLAAVIGLGMKDGLFR